MGTLASRLNKCDSNEGQQTSRGSSSRMRSPESIMGSCGSVYLWFSAPVGTKLFEHWCVSENTIVHIVCNLYSYPDLLTHAMTTPRSHATYDKVSASAALSMWHAFEKLMESLKMPTWGAPYILDISPRGAHYHNPIREAIIGMIHDHISCYMFIYPSYVSWMASWYVTHKANPWPTHHMGLLCSTMITNDPYSLFLIQKHYHPRSMQVSMTRTPLAFSLWHSAFSIQPLAFSL